MEAVMNSSVLSWEGLAEAVGALRLDAAWRRWAANNPEVTRHVMAAVSIVLSLGVVSLSVFAGWWLMWYTTLRKVMFFRELFGLDRQLEEQRRIETEEEIQRVKVRCILAAWAVGCWCLRRFVDLQTCRSASPHLEHGSWNSFSIAISRPGTGLLES
eukprot:evm.model.scf_153.9 EVM.evm.TU.scf_153.9   scf_153:88059-89636(-)